MHFNIPVMSAHSTSGATGGSTDRYSRSGKPLRVVIADDSAVVRELLRRFMERWGYDVSMASDGAEAWKLLQYGDAPTIAILDWIMPEIEGIELCRRVRRLTRRHYTYILLLTAKNEPQNLIEGLGSGADDYICKPPDPGELEARLLVAERIVSFQERLIVAQERYRNLVEYSTALICTHDLEGNVLSINPAAARELQYTVEQCIGKNIREFLPPSDKSAFDLYLKEVAEKQGATGNMAVIDGKGQKHIWAFTNRLFQEPGTAPYVLGHAQDVTEEIKMQKALQESQEARIEAERKLARCDALTGLANRMAFYERAEAERKRSSRYERPLSVAYIDLDNFKHVNDTRGHEAGDQLLVNVAGILQSNLRGEDFAARLGGDEFALLLPEAGHAAAAFVINKLHRLLNAAMQEKNFPVTFSMGVVTYEVPPENTEKMVQKADEVMYAVKHNGKNAIQHVRGT